MQAFKNSGFETRDLAYFERSLQIRPQEAAQLEALGARVLPRGLWDALAGMVREKEIIERRLVLPLSQPDLAHRFAVSPPRSVVLFGPPGTGKTTFAKAVASRLGWPFLELSPSALASEPGGLAAALKAAFREQDHRLLICATNFIHSLDKAFLRHGRFDYVIPIGVPDPHARRAIWTRYLPPGAARHIDVDTLVEHSARFTPADIEFAARQASQKALERAFYADAGSAHEAQGPATQDYLEAVAATRTTVTQAALAEFEEDIASVGRF